MRAGLFAGPERPQISGLLASIRAFGYAAVVSNPRYVPRKFLVVPSDFGRRVDPQWVEAPADWTSRQLAQLDASKLQHQVAYGVTNLFLKPPRTTKMTLLAAQLDMEYNRLQKLLTGGIVMQLEDFSRLRQAVGHNLDYWLLRGPSATYVRAVEADMRRKQERAR